MSKKCMPEDQDHYKSLGVSKNSSPREVRKAYYNLSKQHHPDVGGNEEKFKEINNAYQVLGNQKKRVAYDARPPVSATGKASTQDMAKASDLASAKALSKWAIRKAALMSLGKTLALKKAKDKIAEKISNPGGDILPATMALIPAGLHDFLDGFDTIVLMITQLVGIPLEVGADVTAFGALVTFLKPMFVAAFGVGLAAKAIIVLGWAVFGLGGIIGIVLTGIVWYLTANKIKSGLKNLGFVWKIFSYLFPFILVVDNIPGFSWLPAHTGAVAAFIVLLVIDKLRGAVAGEEAKEEKDQEAPPARAALTA